MKVIKRDGRAVDYNKEKILLAIEKANNEVKEKDKVTPKEIEEIVNYIEDQDKKRILVEDIQDIIEEKLMEYGKFKLAKKYIVYRYTRALVRKQNTTDESILGLIKNQNEYLTNKNSDKNLSLVSNQRDYIAGEVSKDLTKRILLPEKISKAHEEGILYFHNSEYFLQPIFNSSLINIEDMLENGTVINGKQIESPKSFQVACTVITQIILTVASSQYGGQAIDLKILGKYLRKSKDRIKKELQELFKEEISREVINDIIEKRIKKELSAGIQTIKYQLNTLTTANGESPSITLLLNLIEDEYIEENAMIIEEILKQINEGMKDENGEKTLCDYPKLIYVLYEYNSLNGGKYDYLTKLALKSSLETLSPSYISSKKINENYKCSAFSPMEGLNFLSPWKYDNGEYKYEGRFNQGIVSINLPQIAIIADKDEKEFFNVLDERLDLCYEALMCRHYALLGTKADTSPIHWRYGGVSRLDKNKTIDELLKGRFSNLSLGYVGLYETVKLMKNADILDKTGEEFAIKILNHIKKILERWKKETSIEFNLFAVNEENIARIFIKIDKEKFGIIKDITDKDYYTNVNYSSEEIDIFERLKIEDSFIKISLGGISYINSKYLQNEEQQEEMIRYIYNNVQYTELN